MKKLLLCRHAKSSWENSKLRDHERPLANRGLNDAPMMAGRLRTNHIIPEKILTSDALRAKMTASFYLKTFEKNEVIYEETNELYVGTTKSLLVEIRKTSDKIDTLFVFGHNPGMTDLVNYLGENLDNLPTAAIFGFKFEVRSWNAINSENGTFWIYDFPKNPLFKNP
jgi:phosphohistidine phosphatase